MLGKIEFIGTSRFMAIINVIFRLFNYVGFEKTPFQTSFTLIDSKMQEEENRKSFTFVLNKIT